MMIRNLMISLAVLGLGASTSAIAQTVPAANDAAAYEVEGKPGVWMIRGNAGPAVVDPSFRVTVDGVTQKAKASTPLQNGDFYMQLVLECGTRVSYQAFGATAGGKKVSGNRESFNTAKCGGTSTVLAELEQDRIRGRVRNANQ